MIVAIPMKRNMINVEQLRFPSGIATATTLKSMHAKGSESIAQARPSASPRSWARPWPGSATAP